MSIPHAGFAQLSELVRRRAGIVLNAERAHSIAGRLAPVAEMFGFRNSASLMEELHHPHEELASAVTEAVTTKDTRFFRDEPVFAYFAGEILPSLSGLRTGSKRLRILSAGCSTGQETYSLAIALDEAGLEPSGWNIELLATDLSSEAVARTKAGLYSQYELSRGLTPARRARHFAPDGDKWRVRERLRRMLTCRTFNLLDHYGWLGELDVVFCRNVLIYLAPEEKSIVLEKIATVLAPGGYLVLGASESTTGNFPPFVPVSGPRGIFRKA